MIKIHSSEIPKLNKDCKQLIAMGDYSLYLSNIDKYTYILELNLYMEDRFEYYALNKKGKVKAKLDIVNDSDKGEEIGFIDNQDLPA